MKCADLSMHTLFGTAVGRYVYPPEASDMFIRRFLFSILSSFIFLLVCSLKSKNAVDAEH